MRIALATCLKLPEPDPDQQPLLRELRACGADAQMLAWDDPAADCAHFDLCVIRSTWNYIHDLPGFLAWAKQASRQTLLLNPWHIVRWNSHKSYFKTLAARGSRTVPTVFYPRQGRRPLRGSISRHGWDEVVIKPQVGAASYLTRRFNTRRLPAAERFLASSSAQRPMMIQPYVKSVETSGERSLIYLAGKLTHAVRKPPSLAAGPAGEVAVCGIKADERRFALAALDAYRKDILYARVDLARDAAGGLMLMELELVEPSLYLIQEPRALRLFARSCVAAAGENPRSSIRQRGPARLRR